MSTAQRMTLTEIQAAPQAAIRPWLDEHPTLWWGGIAARHQIAKWARGSQPGLAERRAETLGDYGCGQVIRAAAFLTQAQRIKTFNRRHGTYGWKHAAERFHTRRNPMLDYYIGEGAFLIACWALGVPTSRKGAGAYVPLSEAAYIHPSQVSGSSPDEIRA